jgi:hypothetical protein
MTRTASSGRHPHRPFAERYIWSCGAVARPPHAPSQQVESPNNSKFVCLKFKIGIQSKTTAWCNQALIGNPAQVDLHFGYAEGLLLTPRHINLIVERADALAKEWIYKELARLKGCLTYANCFTDWTLPFLFLLIRLR